MSSNNTHLEDARFQGEENDHALDVLKRVTVFQKLKYINQLITVEPLIALYQTAQFLCKPALDNLEFEKSCRVNLRYNETICRAILSGDHKNFSQQNDQIQVIISNMHSWQQPVQSFMPLILLLFLGSFSDRHKCRKPFLLLPVLGELFGVFGCMLTVIYMKSWPLEVQGVSQKVIPSLFGGQIMLVMATTSYIADISSLKMRTLRLGIVQIVLSICSPIVYLFSGVLFMKIGYVGILTISAALYAISFFYGLFWIKEPRKEEKYKKNSILADIFDPTHALDTFKLILKEKPGNNRVYIVTIITVIFIYRAAFDGESNVLYLYTQNVFQWTTVEYSYFITVNGIVHLLGKKLIPSNTGNAVGVPIFTKILHLSDLIILFITILDKIVTNIVFGLADSVPMFYMGVLISMVTRVYKVAKKSFTTKIVSENDIGKAQSLIGICETLAPAVSVPIYNKLVYINTLTSCPSAFFFFSIVFYVICSTLILWMYYKNRTPRDDNNRDIAEVNTECIIETIHL